MTWPIRTTLYPRLVESVQKELCQHNLREEHARREHDEIRVFGMLVRRNRVPDRVKFYVRYDEESHPKVVPVEESLELESGDSPVLLIVLESPHTCEYDGSVATPVGPARGTTGTNIENELGGLLEASHSLIGAVLLFRTLYDGGFPGLIHTAGGWISNIIRSLPERGAGAHGV